MLLCRVVVFLVVMVNARLLADTSAVEGNQKSQSAEEWNERPDDRVTLYTRAILPPRRQAVLDQTPATIQVDISYQAVDAGDVLFVWGLDNWSTIPTKRPPGTTIEDNNVLHTPMKRRGDVFTTQIEVPDDTRLDFGFLITRTPSGERVRWWRDDSGQAVNSGRSYIRILYSAHADEVVDPEAIWPTHGYWLLAISIGFSMFFGVRLAWYLWRTRETADTTARSDASPRAPVFTWRLWRRGNSTGEAS